MGNHLLTLSIKTDNEEEWSGIAAQFAQFLTFEGIQHDQVSISSVNLDPDDSPSSSEDVWFDEYTLFKVYMALEAANVDTYQIKEAITQMQNAGILFRERSVKDA